MDNSRRFAWGDADLKRREPATRKPGADEDSGRCARGILNEVSAIQHGVLLG
jgi:hypothetical protein